VSPQTATRRAKALTAFNLLQFGLHGRAVYAHFRIDGSGRRTVWPICILVDPLSLTSIHPTARDGVQREDGLMELAPRSPPLASPALLLLVAMIFLLLVRPVPAAEPEIIAGAAAVIDGDTFRIGETVVRLYDVDAPEMAQTCDGGLKRLRLCGAYVADALAERLTGHEVRCEVLKVDQYDRKGRALRGRRRRAVGVARFERPGDGVPALLGSLHRGGRRSPNGRHCAVADSLRAPLGVSREALGGRHTEGSRRLSDQGEHQPGG